MARTHVTLCLFAAASEGLAVLVNLLHNKRVPYTVARTRMPAPRRTMRRALVHFGFTVCKCPRLVEGGSQAPKTTHPMRR